MGSKVIIVEKTWMWAVGRVLWKKMQCRQSDGCFGGNAVVWMWAVG